MLGVSKVFVQKVYEKKNPHGVYTVLLSKESLEWE